MQFFIPRIEGKSDQEEVYAAIKKHLTEGLGANFSARRVFSLLYRHDGKEHYAEVGKPHYVNDEPVMVILYERGRNLYHVCTPTRGVIRDMSILVGGPSVSSAVDFDPQPAANNE